MESSARPTIAPDLFRRYVDFIYDQTGIRFEESKNYFIASKVGRRCEVLGIAGPDAYFDYITTGPQRRTELPFFIDNITIHETFFFRNEPQLEAFERDILTPLVAAKRLGADKKIRIWSAACSTGDEVYTTILQVLKNNWTDLTWEIVGTDISQQAVKDAEAGNYSRYAVRNIPADMMQQYFRQGADENTFTISEQVKRMARFSVANLKEPSEIRRLGKFDIVMCRNVLIYFDDKSKEQVLWNIYDTMTADSLLLVGHSENLYAYKHIFKAEPSLSGAFAYRKAPEGTEKLHV